MASSIVKSTQAKRFSSGIKVYFLLSVIIIAGLGYYSFDKSTLYLDLQAGLASNDNKKSELQTELQTEEKSYQNLFKASSETAQKKEATSKDVFPDTEELTVLTRAFEKFFIENDFADNPLKLPSINYESVQNDPTWDYSILPVNITASGSRNNFLKFLEYIENSGLSDNKVRLMTIQNLNITFEKSAPANLELAAEASTTGTASSTKEIEKINFTAKINAYFKKQTIVKQ